MPPISTTSTQAEKEPIASFNEWIGPDIVELYVGDPNSMLFRVHKNILCRTIPYFEKMFNPKSGFKEARENKATFSEDKEESFDVLLEWVYTENVWAWDGKSDIFAAYSLGDKLCLPDFQDMVLDRIRTYDQQNRRVQSFKGIGKKYSATPPGSGFRLYLLHSILYALKVPERLKGEEYKNHDGWQNDDLEAAFLESEDLRKDVLRSMRGYFVSGRDPRNPAQGNACDYHCHDPKESCSRRNGR